MKVDLGTVLFTKAVSAICEKDESFNAFILDSLDRYSDCDWGTLSDEDRELNEKLLSENDSGTIHGVYIYEPTGATIWIMKNLGSRYTTVLLPSDY